MGERHSGQTSSGRRHADGRTGVFDQAALEQHLAAAVRRSAGSDAAEAERRILAAFRAARDSGAHRARTRRRDDWRPRRRRLGGHSVKALLGVVLGGLTLSGVAVAGIGTPGSGQDAPADRDRTTTTPSSPRSSAPPTGRPAPGATATDETSDTSRPARARDTEAHCRAYEKVRDRGKALQAPAWQRLVTAAGGEEKVDAYCAEMTGERNAGNAETPEKDENANKADNADNTENAGNAQRGESAGSQEIPEIPENTEIPENAEIPKKAEIPEIPDKVPTGPARDANGSGSLPTAGQGG
ncbi:hypothetical protein GCM10009535_38600 [Streptomyces thermocarboxydovorans]|uniref:Uncharacterized protein n=1 Tax=Streptomyces thermocarboxydovorans TaxID=59298 RepID=A0ABP3SNN1_9ACTN